MVERSIPTDVIEWASRARQPQIVNIKEEGRRQELRVRKGTPTTDYAPDLVELLVRGAREIVYLEGPAKEQLEYAKSAFSHVAQTLDVVGVSDPVGNFNVNRVQEREVIFDDEAIKASLTEVERRAIYAQKNTITLGFFNDLLTEDGSKLTIDRLFQIVSHALIGAGVPESEVGMYLTKSSGEVRRNVMLQEYIRLGRDIPGIKIEYSQRVEVDAIDKFKPIKVRRPARRGDLY